MATAADSTSSMSGWEKTDAPGWARTEAPSWAGGGSGGGEDWTANPKGEGVYSMNTTDGGMVRVPYSKVLSAGKSGYKLDPKDYSRFMGDFHFAHKKDKDQPHPEDEFASSGIGETAERKGYGLLHGMVDLLPTAGTIGGAMGAGALGIETGPGALATAAAGAAAGAGLGEAVRQKIDEAIWGETTASPLKGIAEEAAGGAAAEVGGRFLGKAIKPAIEYFKPAVENAVKAGFKMLPSEAAGKAAGFLERYAKGSLFSKWGMDAYREVQNQETLKAANKLATDLSSFKGTDAELGKMLEEGIESFRTGFRARQNAAYKQIDTEVRQAGLKLDKQPLIDFAKKELERVGEADVAGGASVVSNKYRAILRDVIEPRSVQAAKTAEKKANAYAYKAAQAAAADPTDATLAANAKRAAARATAATQAVTAAQAAVPPPTYQGMASARSAWLEMAREFQSELGGTEKGLVQQMGKLADQAMEDSVKNSTNPGLWQKVRKANAMTAKAHQMFDMNLIENIVKKGPVEPSTLAKLLTRPNISQEQVGTMMRILPPATRPKVRAHVINSLIKDATGQGKIAFNEREFADSIFKIGDDKGRAIFGRPHWDTIRKIAGYMTHISGEVGSRSGGAAELANPAIMKDLALGGAGLLFGQPFVGAGTMATQAVAINAFAYALRNPETALKLLKYMQTGLRIGPYGLQAGINIMGGQRQAAEHERELRDRAAASAEPESTAGATEEPAVNPDDYSQFMMGPNGDVIGYDGTRAQWVDLQTGAPVQ